MMCEEVRRPEHIFFRDVLGLLSLERWLHLLHAAMKDPYEDGYDKGNQ